MFYLRTKHWLESYRMGHHNLVKILRESPCIKIWLFFSYYDLFPYFKKIKKFFHQLGGLDKLCMCVRNVLQILKFASSYQGWHFSGKNRNPGFLCTSSNFSVIICQFFFSIFSIYVILNGFRMVCGFISRN